MNYNSKKKKIKTNKTKKITNTKKKTNTNKLTNTKKITNTKNITNTKKKLNSHKNNETNSKYGSGPQKTVREKKKSTQPPQASKKAREKERERERESYLQRLSERGAKIVSSPYRPSVVKKKSSKYYKLYGSEWSIHNITDPTIRDRVAASYKYITSQSTIELNDLFDKIKEKEKLLPVGRNIIKIRDNDVIDIQDSLKWNGYFQEGNKVYIQTNISENSKRGETSVTRYEMTKYPSLSIPRYHRSFDVRSRYPTTVVAGNPDREGLNIASQMPGAVGFRDGINYDSHLLAYYQSKDDYEAKKREKRLRRAAWDRRNESFLGRMANRYLHKDPRLSPEPKLEPLFQVAEFNQDGLIQNEGDPSHLWMPEDIAFEERFNHEVISPERYGQLQRGFRLGGYRVDRGTRKRKK